MKFKLSSEFEPKGDQEKAISKICENMENKKKRQTLHQTLLGVTGSGKTFTMAKVVEKIQKPTLIISHNKTLAAQLYTEFRSFFPENAISYFVSYYDYYQPEAYIAKTDTYIEKETSINEEINKYRHRATKNLLTRNDVLIISTVSCIYGLGDVDDYNLLAVSLKVGQEYDLQNVFKKLINIQYSRSVMSLERGQFKVAGDTVTIFPASSDNVFRLEFFGNELEKINKCDFLTGEIIESPNEIKIFPAKHNITSREKVMRAISGIKKDLEQHYSFLKEIGKNIEAERLKIKTEHDIEMLLQTGYTNGIENYIRYFSGSHEKESLPSSLLDYLPKDFLMFIDESHITVPQIGAMHNGNRSRKNSLVEHGFRLPSAHDNRPLKFGEFEKYMNNVLFVSATPRDYEKEKSEKNIVEQIIRPTGLLDPKVELKSKENYMDNLLENIHKTIEKGDRVLVISLTKKDSEILSDYLIDLGIKTQYLHADIDSIERIKIIENLRRGEIDVIVGINLLREGLDIPEVSLVAILDADVAGFLRSADALIQIIGRAARNSESKVIMYTTKEKNGKFKITPAMKKALSETKRRRKIQKAHNKKYGIIPKTIKKEIKNMQIGVNEKKKIPKNKIKKHIKDLEKKLKIAVENWDFETAINLRNEIKEYKRD